MLMFGDCIERMKTLPDCSVDAVVTDPPYGLAFMGKKWDYDVPAVEVWAECLRVLKPGGHLLAFAGTRTQHRMAVRIEDAGFEIRDMIAWVYGSGFPKSLDVSKAIDKAAGASGGRGPMKRGGERLARLADGKRDGEGRWGDESGRDPFTYAPATDAARQWSGWGTAIKPAMEPITVARKPLTGTVAENVQEWGTGAINVDGCRVAHGEGVDMSAVQRQSVDSGGGWGMCRSMIKKGEVPMYKPGGRWPANLIHDGSDEVVGLFPQAGGGFGRNGDGSNTVRRQMKFGMKATGEIVGYGDSGSAARFFYVPKASKADRDEGCEGLEYRTAGEMVDREEGTAGIDNPRAGAGRTGGTRNHHPTVKPTALMRYLCRLVTPPGGIVLDPFMGSGSTGKGAMLEGFRFIGIERDPDYMQIAESRIQHAIRQAAEVSDVPHQLELEVASA